MLIILFSDSLLNGGILHSGVGTFTLLWVPLSPLIVPHQNWWMWLYDENISVLTSFLLTIAPKVMKSTVKRFDGFTVIRGWTWSGPLPALSVTVQWHTPHPRQAEGELAVNPDVTVAPPSHHPSGTLTQLWQSAACDVVCRPVYSLETH